ncbi:hypothetical protein QFZ56_001708 [Streptomyces achromogenes]|uniref:Uncharacterized protein n=1 Tax=Streptomyces achromogenes TaxID=67255 RepID=A0ABU0PWG6_STRAH|nr:hypothetical protein [Streptomyces achromogenes]
MRGPRSRAGFDGVAGRAAEGEADRHHDERGDQRAEVAEAVALVVQALREDGEDQHDRADDLRGQVLPDDADLRAGGEDAQDRARALLLRLDGLDLGGLSARPADDLLVGQVRVELAVVGDPDQGGADGGAEQLPGPVDRNVAPVVVLDRECEGDRRVEVGAGEGRRGVDSRQNGETPPEGDGEPAGVAGLGGLQRHGGADAAAEQDEYGGTDGLADEDVGAGHPRLLCPSSREAEPRVPPGVRAPSGMRAMPAFGVVTL